ncbi:MAG TPA: RNA-binding S4 domain-containing protein [Paludibacteraceae bacterium]|nr:RNA-binding S4 domain-containing protein [Paludibacteraceae bacterium]HOU69312.1 RNA-binding S4 domain-containing protein [Paludibacteraceae bacterium]HPH63676.1 RNA-binding S4 domain-containing protein [Paludibacteraceae bacterium]HQF51052.1 RNA-binding S4 domain-containing protein [Paludibacteraceae bacterium]HQJ90237.1 RNA-binding S4 domain-containing protein [Paludibacteraceae bacterium]
MAEKKKDEVRIDKWMWAVRLFKTRSMAADACKKGKIQISGSAAKPSRSVKVGDIIQIKRPPVLFSFKVLALSENRMGAKLVPEFMENVTTPDQLELMELGRYAKSGLRDRGTGRPTKKERRDLETYVEPSYASDADFDFDFDFSDDDDLDENDDL